MTAFSIIMPILNGQAYLAEAIASIRAQDFADWELVVVDDGSTDATREIAGAEAALDSRIRYIEPDVMRPHGAAAARNFGMSIAKGDYLAFLDADDIFEPGAFSCLFEAARRFPTAATIMGPTRWWHPQSEALDWIETTDGRAGRLHQPPDLLVDVVLLLTGHVPCICSVLVKRQVTLERGGFEERFRLYEDQTLWVKLFLERPVYVVPQVLSRYRQHGGSVSHASTLDGEYNRLGAHPARAAFLDWVQAYVDLRGIKDRRIAHALALARAPYAPAASPKTVKLRAELYLRQLPFRFGGRLRGLALRLTGGRIA